MLSFMVFGSTAFSFIGEQLRFARIEPITSEEWSLLQAVWQQSLAYASRLLNYTVLSLPWSAFCPLDTTQRHLGRETSVENMPRSDCLWRVQLNVGSATPG